MKTIAIILSLFLFSPAWAAMWYLDASVASSGNGTSWALAKKTWAEMDILLDALGDDGAGDTVVIPGAGYAPSGAGWGMNVPTRMFDYFFTARRYVNDFVQRSRI